MYCILSCADLNYHTTLFRNSSWQPLEDPDCVCKFTTGIDNIFQQSYPLLVRTSIQFNNINTWCMWDSVVEEVQVPYQEGSSEVSRSCFHKGHLFLSDLDISLVQIEFIQDEITT